jgi:hypothetical protein
LAAARAGSFEVHNEPEAGFWAVSGVVWHCAALVLVAAGLMAFTWGSWSAIDRLGGIDFSTPCVYLEAPALVMPEVKNE